MTRNLMTALRLAEVVGVTVARSVVPEQRAVLAPVESRSVTASWRPATNASKAPGMHTGAPGTLTTAVSVRDIVMEAGKLVTDTVAAEAEVATTGASASTRALAPMPTAARTGLSPLPRELRRAFMAYLLSIYEVLVLIVITGDGLLIWREVEWIVDSGLPFVGVVIER